MRRDSGNDRRRTRNETDPTRLFLLVLVQRVLTLSAFALEFGEFWLLSQYLPTEPLAKSLAIIKRVPQLTKPGAIRKHHNAILELNNLIKASWQVIDIIIELERLNSHHDIKEVPALAPALEQFPVDVYWVIITIAAIVTQLECLTTDSDKRQDLSQFGQKIKIKISKLRKHVSQCTIQIDEAEYNKLLKKLFQTPTKIMEVCKVLIFWKDTPKAPIYDGSTKTLVNIEVLKKKDVFLFISTLDISQEDISILIPIYDHIKKTGNQHKIVWVPIVEEWNDKLRKKFDSLKSKMPWYVLHHFAPIKGIKYIKEDLHFKNKHLFVVLSPQGKILHQNVFHMIQVWGVKAFPFSKSKEESLTQALMWIDSLLV
ncbi:protein SIEVE ELEMENT OCCLUSION B [Trifolium repens]|nr:protein SIEVE ELEMENT OCCLUSION B [Trifolium repens]